MSAHRQVKTAAPAPLIAALMLVLLLGIASPLSAQTWLASPASGSWNSAANWSPQSVPNSSSATATFNQSSTNAITISGSTIVGKILFNSGTTAYTITTNPLETLTISGSGVVNNSGTTQNFVTADSGSYGSVISFTNSASAGSNCTYTNIGCVQTSGTLFVPFGEILFYNNSSAGGATFINDSGTGSSEIVNSYGGLIEFTNNSTAGTGTFINNGSTITRPGDSSQGSTRFYDQASAGHATFINNAAVDTSGDGFTTLEGTATASNAVFINNGAMIANGAGGSAGLTNYATAASGSFINYPGTVANAGGGFTGFGQMFSASGTTNAANATVINYGATISGAKGGETIFQSYSTAGGSTLIAFSGSNGGGGGQILFSGTADGGTARVIAYGTGLLDISALPIAGMNIGSIEGSGNFYLGNKTLTVGTNNRSTTVSGIIRDGKSSGGGSGGGSIVKTGTCTLTLTGTNTYTGPTTINSGTLEVDGSISTGTVTVNSTATLSGTGIVNDPSTIATGGTLAPGSVNGPGPLTFSNALTLNNGSALTIALGSPSSSDQVTVSGTVISMGTTPINISALTGLTSGTYLLITGNSGINASNFTLNPSTAGTLISTGATLSLVVNSFTAWQYANFGIIGNAGQASETATPANDAIPNLVKYALGLNPTTPYSSTSPSMPSTQIAASGTNQYLSLTFSGTAPDVTYIVEATGNLTTPWTPLQTWPAGSPPGSVTVTDTIPISSSSERFIRLRLIGP